MDLRIFTEPQQGASYDDLLAVARRAELCGYSAFFRSDHYLSMGDVDPLPGPTDAWTTLAGLARETSTIRLGTLVTSATFRNPGVLAVQVAQVDQMSGGRVELGLGAGWYEAEHQAYGIEFPSVGERFDRLQEQLQIITGMFGTPVGQRFDHDGQHYSLKDSPALPKPVQDRVPVIIGGRGRRRTPALAARYATEFNRAFDSTEDVARVYGYVREACEHIGRDPAELDWSAALVLCCGRDEAEVRRRADAIGRRPDELRRSGAAGTPAEVVDTIGRYAEVGVQRLYLQVLDLADLDHLDLVAEQVAPQV
jgi:F420-dependent oxidoreductase-like protein